MNKKIGIAVIVVVIIGLLLAKSLNIGVDKTVNWAESFNEKSNQPYGVSVLHKELPNIFKDQEVKTVYYYPNTYLYANSEDGYGDFVASGNYIIVGNSNYLGEFDIEELLTFVSNGNTLFISDYKPPQQILDTLNLEVDFVEHTKDSTTRLGFSNFNLKPNETVIDRTTKDYYFSSFSDNYKTLGYAERESKYVNFLEIPHEDGKILLHLEPKAFTNYNLLKDERYKYAEGVFAYLPTEDVLFDSYTKYYDPYYGDAKKKSDLSWFLSQIAFKWAWYLALLFTLIFIIFNAKRRQRIIKTIKPLENTTIGFVKTISNLYFETQDHKNLVHKKITYFLAKIREDYNLDTSNLNDEFIEHLSAKAGKSKETTAKLIHYINKLRSKNEFFEENLTYLNRYIEAFYSK